MVDILILDGDKISVHSRRVAHSCGRIRNQYPGERIGCVVGDCAQTAGTGGQSHILQILSLTLFEKTPISCALHAIDEHANFVENVNQLTLFEF
jgi:hypothetical protein